MSRIKQALIASAALFIASPAFAQEIQGGGELAAGTSGQFQINLNNQFAGLTLAGDVTAVNTSTGAVTVSTVSGGLTPATIPSAPTTGHCVQWASATTLGDFGGSCAGSGVPANLTLTNPASAATFTLIGGKTFTVNNTLTLAGTDGTTMTFPTTSATIARTDNTNTFTGTQSFASTINMGSGAAINVLAMKAVVATAPSAPAAGCGSTTAVSNANGTLSFTLTIGGTGITSACQFTLPAATHSWHCWGDDITTATEVLHQTALATNSATMTFYALTTGLATAPNTGDVILESCLGN